jgi:hypothetical protein
MLGNREFPNSIKTDAVKSGNSGSKMDPIKTDAAKSGISGFNTDSLKNV